MSRGVNKVILIGKLGDDPKNAATNNGQNLTTFFLATSEKFNDRHGQLRETIEWHKVVLYGRVAQIGAQYLVKGSHVYIEGKLKTTQWEDKHQQKRYRTEIIGHRIELLGGPEKKHAFSEQPCVKQQLPLTPPAGQTYEEGEPVPF